MEQWSEGIQEPKSTSIGWVFVVLLGLCWAVWIHLKTHEGLCNTHRES